MLNSEKLVASPALHSFISSTIELMLVTCEVKGADIEAYACDKERPMSACFKAPQSLAPSPHIDTFLPICWKTITIFALSLGFVLAKTVAFPMNYLCTLEIWATEPEKSSLNALPVTQSWLLLSSAFWVALNMNSSLLSFKGSKPSMWDCSFR